MKEIRGDIVLLGLENLKSNQYIYKVEIDCEANNQFSVNRAFMKKLKEEYEKNNISVPGNYLEIKKN